MGPSNIALVKLFRADQSLRDAQNRLDDASKSVRLQERRLVDLNEKLRLAQTQLREAQAKCGQFELDIKSRDAKIEKYRQQQQTSNNHKEYQAFLTEINTEKIDKAKVEEELLKVMELVEKLQATIKDMQAQVEGDSKKYEEIKAQLGGKLAELQAEVDRLKPERDEAAAPISPRVLHEFDRMAERYEGEAMCPIKKPDRRREEYICGVCHMDLVADVYNRLHSRDDMVQCSSCRRLMYIPEDLPPDQAINKPRERRETRGDKKATASVGRQRSAVDVMRSINGEEEAAAAESVPQPGPEAASDAPAISPQSAPTEPTTSQS